MDDYKTMIRSEEEMEGIKEQYEKLIKDNNKGSLMR